MIWFNIDTTRVVPVTPERHGNKCWRRPSSSAFAAGEQIAPLVGMEIHLAALAMPLAFVLKDDCYLIAGIQSPFSGTNYFVDSSGKWLGAYVPAYFRGYPFSVSPPDGQAKRVLCIEESSDTISEDQGEPFFDDTGALAKPVREVLEFLTKVEQNRTVTMLAVSALSDAGLIVEWPLSIHLGGKDIKVEGLFRVDEARLKSLDNDTFLGLRSAGALPISYAQLLSMGNVRFFHKLSEIKEQYERPPKLDLDKLLGNDDIFKF